MIKSRNQTSHTYNLSIANDIVDKIINHYSTLFETFLQKMRALGEH